MKFQILSAQYESVTLENHIKNPEDIIAWNF